MLVSWYPHSRLVGRNVIFASPWRDRPPVFPVRHRLPPCDIAIHSSIVWNYGMIRIVQTPRVDPTTSRPTRLLGETLEDWSTSQRPFRRPTTLSPKGVLLFPEFAVSTVSRFPSYWWLWKRVVVSTMCWLETVGRGGGAEGWSRAMVLPVMMSHAENIARCDAARKDRFNIITLVILL